MTIIILEFFCPTLHGGTVLDRVYIYSCTSSSITNYLLVWFMYLFLSSFCLISYFPPPLHGHPSADSMGQLKVSSCLKGDFPVTVACLEVSLRVSIKHLETIQAVTKTPCKQSWTELCCRTLRIHEGFRRALCQVRQGADFSQIPAAWGWFPASLSLRVSGVTFRSFEVSLCHAAFSCW